MSDDKKKAIDFDAVASALEKLAETPNASALTLKQQLREPKVYDGIKKAKAAGYRSAQIVSVLTAQGIETTEATFRQYWREIEKEDGGESKVKSDAKAKANKSRNAATTSESKADSSKQSDGKPLTKKPAMGGAFSGDL